ncbi:universal stress protein [Mycobacterium shigaense]|nr:universal stress protein [Mycobacterium shigaense]
MAPSKTTPDSIALPSTDRIDRPPLGKERTAMSELPIYRPVVVGIDGSKAAIHAALWAVDEAVRRDVPLRLLHTVGQENGHEVEPDAMASKLTAAQTAIQRAVTAIEAKNQLVKIETEIAQGPPVGSLIRASAAASLVCVGALGLRHFEPGRTGSTAGALAVSARCPVAIVRGHHEQRPAQRADDVVVEVNGSPDNGVLLGTAIEEASLRNVGVRAVVCAPAAPGGDDTTTDGDHRARADLDRRLARWRRRYPDVRVESVVAHGSLLDYVAHKRRATTLMVVGAHSRPHLDELLGPRGSAILRDAQCSLLIVNQQNL